MKFKIIIVYQIVFSSFAFSQNYNSLVEDLINQTNLDSLVSYVRILSGEDYVVIGDSMVLIENRINSRGNDLAAEYIKQKLESNGLDTYDQHYSEKGRNVYSIQKGTIYPKKYFILCAHYDAVANHCADDNASGVAGVLEAARILSDYQFNYSIIYALWDEEETGLNGSEYFASKADSFDMNILGVVNMDMIGWDDDGDGLLEIHTMEKSNSVSLAEFLYAIDSVYNLPLKPQIINPGTGASDHSSFWYYDYSAVLMIEAYYNGDFNQYYHSDRDRIDKFNLTFFHNAVRMGLGSIATLALENTISPVIDENVLPGLYYIYNYPNPFNSSTIIQYEIPAENYITMELYNSIGEKVEILFSGYQIGGRHEYNFNSNNLTSGIYFIILKYSNHTLNHKIVLLK